MSVHFRTTTVRADLVSALSEAFTVGADLVSALLITSLAWSIRHVS